jgi:pilus assembly protein CpaF
MGPLALDGTLVSIRRFRADAITAEDLLASEALSVEMLHFLLACVKARANIVISGGTGSGKTTLLNILSSAIPPSERVVTIEDAAELRLAQPHVARLESRPPNLEGSGEVTARDLLRNALRMRPDRIVIGECRGGEAFDMLQAMNTGHDGSLTTLHANSTQDAVSRLELLVGLAGFPLSPGQIARQIASAVQLLVHVSRLDDGRRKIVQISEIATVHHERVVLRDLFSFEQQGIDPTGRVTGKFRAHGHTPLAVTKIHARGMHLDPTMFLAPGHDSLSATSGALQLGGRS